MANDTLRQQFKDLDRDGSGLVDAEELFALMPKGDLEQARQVLGMLDQNGDGKVSLDEFLSAYSGD